MVKLQGLGLEDIKGWNQACFLLLIRKILLKDGSIWVAWLHSYIMKENSFWDIGCAQNFSWAWRNILQLRTKAASIQGLLSLGTVAMFWQEIRYKKEKVPWEILVWHPGHIPKNALISRMAILDWLLTKSRLLSFGLAIDGERDLCMKESETREHLFFECEVFRLIWSSILALCR
ncbi:uncharacterized protein LOC120162129 isoform X1 [Hibiscus syriacus]|uniref:uncharacterized protein LOC120162129 isoform X1 n=1 Tax=Hibiscus syriacus TaxID=106335 RepID=UPI0019218FEE|nr:uncharacterized protein LOC120162129 isoform X1 [Hibiscus syriacus]